MNISIPLALVSLFVTPFSSELTRAEKEKTISCANAPASPAQADYNRIKAVEFKAQEYCRAELKDFEFDAKFKVVSATVYFTGANFPSMQTGYITSNSLKPIEQLKSRCTTGSIVIFDNIKVKGPDEQVRMIEPVSYMLY